MTPDSDASKETARPPGDESREASAPEKASTPRLALFALVSTVALALDVVTKLLVVENLPEGRITRTLGGAVYLDQARNSGAAFSLGTGFTIVLTVVALAVVVVIVRAAKRLRSIGWAASLGLILGGALGNLGDRVFRSPGLLRGRVVDWISVFGPNGQRWPIFNIADSAIVTGAILAALLVLLGVEIDGRRATKRASR